MDLTRSLFDGDLVRLTPIDAEKDAETASRWSHDAEYLRMVGFEAARPLSPAQVKKAYEEIEKQVEEDKNLFYFAIRLRADERLVGFVRLHDVSWTHGSAALQMGIGERADRRRGYGSEALDLILGYAFDELNLFRLVATVGDYNLPALRAFEKAGFVVELRRRRAINRAGRRWDALGLGLLREEWERRRGNARNPR